MSEPETKIARRQTVGVAGTPGQGPHMVMVLKWDGDVIAEASYLTYGCPVAHTCGTYVAQAVEGKTAGEATTIDEAAVISAVGQMPLGRAHCPGLAVTSLRNALQQAPDGG